MLITKTKSELRELFKYTSHTNYNKFWRKAFNGTGYNYKDYYTELHKGLTEVKICQDTINQFKKIKSSDNVFIFICQNSKYTKEEISSILQDNVGDIDWYGIYHRCDLDFDFKVKYYQEIRNSYLTKYRGTNDSAEIEFKELEREFKIKELLEDK